MRLAAIALSKSGVTVCRRLQAELQDLDIYIKESLIENEREFGYTTPFSDFVGRIFAQYDGLCFVMAAGIVVRHLAPYLQNKKYDPAVVVIDDLGQNVISLLSGHLGGANQLTRQLAEILDAHPVITTATDLHQVPAFDLLAKEAGMKIERLENLKYISLGLIDGQKIGCFTDLSFPWPMHPLVEVAGDLDDFAALNPLHNRWHGLVLITHRRLPEDKLQEWAIPGLILRPVNLVVGMGLRRGKRTEELQRALELGCELAGVSLLSVAKIVTIDRKADEQGLQELCLKLGLPLQIVSTAEVREIEDRFAFSKFVKATIGVGGVAEPSAYLGAPQGRWILRKEKLDGVTVAIRLLEMV